MLPIVGLDKWQRATIDPLTFLHGELRREVAATIYHETCGFSGNCILCSRSIRANNLIHLIYHQRAFRGSIRKFYSFYDGGNGSK